jgi:aldose 1-epimerase
MLNTNYKNIMRNSFKKPTLALAIAGSMFVAACNQSAKKNTSTMTDSTSTTPKLPPAFAFEKTINGKQTHLYILKNKNGVEAAVTNYGGRIVSLLVPNKDGKLTDVV